MKRPISRLAGASVLFTGFAAAFSSCTTPATEIVAGMTTQMQVPKELKSVGVVVSLGGQLVFCQSYPVADGSVRLPSTLGVAPQEDREGVLEPVTVSVLGFRTLQGEKFDVDCVVEIPEPDEMDPANSEVSVVRRRRMPYIEERIVYLPMPLKESCSGVACMADQTCIGGVCESMDVDMAAVVDYRDSLVFGLPGLCFSPSRCMPTPSVLTQPAVLVDADNCTFTFPVPPNEMPPDTLPEGLNVELTYTSFGTEILDLDDMEGFVFPDPNDPLTFRLAENLCESNYKAGKIANVTASVSLLQSCVAKRALQPICDDELPGIQEGSRAPLGTSGESLCSVGQPLRATESALYVLMDNSASMAESFGPDGLAFAVEVPLRNPVAARTSVGFSFYPAMSSDCGTSSYSTPTFGFGEVESVRLPIAQAIGDTGTVAPDDQETFLDAAVTGAYQALAALTPTESTRFNRRALVIVGNRDLQDHCTTPALDEVANLAAVALTDNQIYTYVAVLSAPGTANQFGDDPQTSAAAIATAGGTTVFDAVADEEEGALAVQKVLNDLGSCLYDPGSTPKVEQFATHLSYVDPLSNQRIDIVRDDSCNSEMATADGFGFEGDFIRICGPSCDQLRTTLTDVAAFFAVLQQPAPQIPIVPTGDCTDEQRFLLD